MKILKKSKTILLVLLMLFTSFNYAPKTEIKAVSRTVTEEFVSGWSYAFGTVWGQGAILKVDGEEAFCLEPTKTANVGPNNEISPSDIGLSQNQINRFALIAWYGYRSNPTVENYFLTNNLIWRELGNPSRVVNATYPTEASMTPWFNEVLNKVNNFSSKPSFESLTYEVNVNQTLTLEDTNGVLSGLSIKPVAGATVTKNGNTLTVTPDLSSSDEIEISFDRGMSTSQTRTNFVVRSGSSQAISPCLSGRDPYMANVYIKVNKFGSLKMVKQDEDGTLVPNTTFAVSANADMSSPIGSYTTGADGSITNSELIPGTYFVQETAVPNHLVLDSTIKSVVIRPNETTTYTATNNWIKGYIKVVKKDVDTGKTVTKANTTFSLYKNDGTYLQDITTDASGMITSGLYRWGDYYLLEKTAPNGYTHSNQKLVYQIRDNGSTYTAELSNKRVTGSISIKKEDSITGSKPQGDASLSGAVYELKARNAIVDPADGSAIYAKDTVIKTLTTDANADASASNLYLGKYYVKEKTPSKGYTLDPTEYDVTLSYADQNTSVITKAQTVKEKVIDGDFKITKVIEVDPSGSEITKPEKDAEFIAVLKKYVDQYGTVEEAYKHKADFAAKEYDLLVTDKDGEDTSKKLAYGTYLVQQTKVGDENVDMLEKPFEVKIESENQPTIKYVVSNQKFLSYLQLEKKDAETGKTVTLSNTSFKIYDVENDKYLSQRVGLVRHDTWTTDDTGKVTLPLKVPAGKYRLEEIKAPDGYLLNTDKIDFIMKESNVSIVDDEGEPIQIVTFSDSKPTGSTKLIKTDADTSEALSGVQYQLTAAKDIIDVADGSIVYEEGDPVSMDISENGYYLTNELGEIDVEGLLLGSYTWKETKAFDGYVQDKKEYTFELKQKDDVQKVYTHEQELTNQKTKVEILKEDTNSNALVGAHLRLVDEDENVVKEWISKKTSLKLEGLLVDKEYTLYEDEAPEGYMVSKPVKFTIKNTTKIQKFNMIDNQVSAFKTDVDGKALPGATMQVVSTKTKNIVDQWTSTDKTHYISNLIEGQEYILRELKAPKGYVLAKEITFVANDKKEVQSISMTDKQVIVEKTDNEGKAVKGSSLQIVDKDNNIVDSWVSSDEGHAASGLVVDNEYTLQELEAPKGYVLAKDVKFTINDKKEIQTISMIDKQVTALKIDEDGNVLPGAKMQVVSTKTKDIVDEWISTGKAHNISNLIEGNGYILRELEAPNGLELAEDIEFTVDDKKVTQALEMSDKYIVSEIMVNKVDYYDRTDILKVAEFTIYKDKECLLPIKVEKTDTSNGIATFKKMRYGTYYIKETAAPAGYELSKEVIEVTIDDDWISGTNKQRTIIFPDKLLPSSGGTSTGDITSLQSYVLLLSVSSLMVLHVVRKRKETNK